MLYSISIKRGHAASFTRRQQNQSVQSDRARNGRSYFFRRPARTRTTVTPAAIAKLATALVIVRWRSTRIRHPLSVWKQSLPIRSRIAPRRGWRCNETGTKLVRLISPVYQFL